MKLSFPEYVILAALRNGIALHAVQGNLGPGDVLASTVESLRHKKLIKEYEVEITEAGHQVMAEYSDGSKAA